MKKILVFILVLCNVSLFAQRRNGGGQNNNNVKQLKTPKFDAAKRAGIFYYDTEEVIKKVIEKKRDHY